MRPQKGFSLIECMAALGIILVILGIGIPIYKNAVDGIRLKEATRNYAGILQKGMLKAVSNNRYNAIGVQLFDPSCAASCELIAYVDTADTRVNPVSAYAAPEPMAMLGSGVLWDQAGAPATHDLQTKVSNGRALGYPPVFGSRGLPCALVAVKGGNVCNSEGGNVAFVTYFESPLGRWEAVTVNPAGRIQTWAYDPGASVWKQL